MILIVFSVKMKNRGKSHHNPTICRNNSQLFNPLGHSARFCHAYESQTKSSVSLWNQTTFVSFLVFNPTIVCWFVGQVKTGQKPLKLISNTLPTFQSRAPLDKEKPILTSFMRKLNTMSMMTLCRGFEEGSFWSATPWFEVQHSPPSGPIYSCYSHWGIRILTPNTVAVRTVVIFSWVVSLLTQSVTIHWRRHRSSEQYSFVLIHDKKHEPEDTFRSTASLKCTEAWILGWNTSN